VPSEGDELWLDVGRIEMATASEDFARQLKRHILFIIDVPGDRM
jgi:hypothetical protein